MSSRLSRAPLNRVHHVGLRRIDVSGKVRNEVHLRQPAEACRPRQVRQRRRWRPTSKEATKVILPVDSESGDVHERRDVGFLSAVMM